MLVITSEFSDTLNTHISPMNVAIRYAPNVLSREGTDGSKAKGLTGVAAVGGADMMGY